MSPVRVESSINSSSWFDRQRHQAVLKSEYATNALHNCNPAAIHQLSQCVVQLQRDEQRFTPEEKTLIQLAAGYKLQQLFLEKKTQDAACLEQKQRTLTVLMTRYDAMKKQAGGSSLIAKSEEINTLCKELAPIASLDKKSHKDIQRLETDIGIDLKKHQPDIPATTSKLQKISEKIYTLDVHDPLFDKKTREILKESLPVLAQVSSIIFLSALYTHSFENFSTSIGKIMPEPSASIDSERAGRNAKYEEYISLTEQSFAQIPALYEVFVEFRNALQKKDDELKAGKKISPREKEKYKKDFNAGDYNIVVENANNYYVPNDKKNIGQFTIKPLEANQKSIHEIIHGEENASGSPSLPNGHIEENNFPVEIIHGFSSEKWNESTQSFSSKKGSSVNINTAAVYSNDKPPKDLNSPTGVFIEDEESFLSSPSVTSPDQEEVNLLREKFRESEKENSRLVDNIEKIDAELMQLKEQNAILLSLQSENKSLKSDIVNLKEYYENEMQDLKKERDRKKAKYLDADQKIQCLNDIDKNKNREIDRLNKELEKLKNINIGKNHYILKLEKYKSELEEDIDNFKSTISEYQKDKKELERIKKELEEEIEELEMKIEELETEILDKNNSFYNGNRSFVISSPERKIKRAYSDENIQAFDEGAFIKLIKEFDRDTIAECLEKSFNYYGGVGEQENISSNIFKIRSKERDFARQICLDAVVKFKKNIKYSVKYFSNIRYEKPLNFKELLKDESLKKRPMMCFGELELIDYELMRYVFLSIQDYYNSFEARKNNKRERGTDFFLYDGYTLKHVCNVALGIAQDPGQNKKNDMSTNASPGTGDGNTLTASGSLEPSVNGPKPRKARPKYSNGLRSQ